MADEALTPELTADDVVHPGGFAPAWVDARIAALRAAWATVHPGSRRHEAISDALEVLYRAKYGDDGDEDGR